MTPGGACIRAVFILGRQQYVLDGALGSALVIFPCLQFETNAEECLANLAMQDSIVNPLH